MPSGQNEEPYGGVSVSVNLDCGLLLALGGLLARGKNVLMQRMHWDFAIILLVLGVAVPLLGRRRIRKLMEAASTTKTERLVLYASTIAFQWIVVALILWRTHARQIAPAALGLALPRPGATLLAAVVLCALILVNQTVALRRLKDDPDNAAHGILPHLARKVFPQDGPERVAFAALVLTVSICEEIIYRGFAQRVFQDWAASVAVAIVGSAAMFSLAHLYQGRRGLVSTFVVGLLFSIVRALTGTLAPASAAHFVADITAGFLAPAKVRDAKAEAVISPN